MFRSRRTVLWVVRPRVERQRPYVHSSFSRIKSQLLTQRNGRSFWRAGWPKIKAILDRMCQTMDVLSIVEIDQTEMLPRLLSYFDEHPLAWNIHWVPYSDDADSQVFFLACCTTEYGVSAVEPLGRRASPAAVGHVITTTRNDTETPVRMDLWQIQPGTEALDVESACVAVVDILEERRIDGSRNDTPVMFTLSWSVNTDEYPKTIRRCGRPFRCSTEDLIARQHGNTLSSFKAFPPDCAGMLMTDDERAEEERLLDDPRGLRALHERVIDRADAERFRPWQRFGPWHRDIERTNPALRHAGYPGVEYGIVQDEAYIFNAGLKGPVYADMMCHLETETWAVSNHAVLVTTVFFAKTMLSLYPLW